MILFVREWLESEIKALRNFVGGHLSIEQIARALRRPVEDVRGKAVELGLWGKTIPIDQYRKVK
jgi:hypothetical protein